VADELVKHVYNSGMVIQHPKFMSFVTSAVSPYGLTGAILSDIYNQNACVFDIAPGAGVIEEKLINFMGKRAGFDDNCGGVFTSGGSLSNLTGFIAARNTMLKEEEYSIGTAYISDQAHSSIRKGIKLMGTLSSNLRIIPTDEHFKIRLDLLEEAIKKDIADGKKPFLIVGTCGTTNTGTIDPFIELGKIKEKYNCWFHVDGAFGGSILFSDIYKNLAKGIENADSLSWDTHKWAMQPYSCSCLIAKNKENLLNTYAEHPEYLADIMDAEHADGCNLGIEMSRPTRCLKLWFTIQAMGTDLLSDVIDYSFYNAKIAVRELAKNENWKLKSEPCCGTLTFRYEPKNIPAEKYDELCKAISDEIIRQEYAYVVTTVIKDERVLRLILINPNTTEEDVIGTVQRLTEIAVNITRRMA